MRCTSLDEQRNGTPEPRRRRRAAAQQKAFEEFEKEQLLEQQREAAEQAGQTDQDEWGVDEAQEPARSKQEPPRRMKTVPVDRWLEDEDDEDGEEPEHGESVY